MPLESSREWHIDKCKIGTTALLIQASEIAKHKTLFTHSSDTPNRVSTAVSLKDYLDSGETHANL